MSVVMVDRITGPRDTVALLEADPDLGAGLDGEELDAARTLAVASVIEATSGNRAGPRPPPRRAGWASCYSTAG